MRFEESSRTFVFDPKWQVTRFDHHRYFRWLSGQGLKGIDFVAIQPNESLLFIEVKNYRKEVPSAEKVAEVFCEKIWDSVRIVDVIQQYYKRHFFFRVVRSWIRRWPHRFGEWGYWTELSELLENPMNCHFILWVEGENLEAPYLEAIIHHVSQRIEEGYRFHLLPYERNSQSFGFEVI